MSDIYAKNAQYAATGALVGSQLASHRGAGHVGFRRQDGPAEVAISAELTPEAALRLDGLLRDLIAEDAPRLAAWCETLRQEALAQQRDAYEQAAATQQLQAGFQRGPNQ